MANNQKNSSKKDPKRKPGYKAKASKAKTNGAGFSKASNSSRKESKQNSRLVSRTGEKQKATSVSKAKSSASSGGRAFAPEAKALVDSYKSQVKDRSLYLPVCREDMEARDWYYYDFLLITGDAYVDHPSFGAAVIGRLLEKAGYRVAICAQPPAGDSKTIAAFGRPKLGVLITAGNLDSMVAHYTAAKKRRNEDFYSPGKRAGLRPDRATIVYAKRVREAWGSDIPVIIGGLEASLRRFAHYDYWDNKVRASYLEDSVADILIYGMGETATLEIAAALKRKKNPRDLANFPAIRGTCMLLRENYADKVEDSKVQNSAVSNSNVWQDFVGAYGEYIELQSLYEITNSRRDYADATRIQNEEHDPIIGRTMVQRQKESILVCFPPQKPLSREKLDEVAALPYTREPHPDYDSMGGVPAIEEVRFSVIHNRGCIGACNFCSLAYHQGRMITSRSHESIVSEVMRMTEHPLFKGVVSDVGGPTANFRDMSCDKQKTCGLCKNRKCLVPTPCPNLKNDHSDYSSLLSKLRAIPGVKKVFIKSGIRYDFMLAKATPQVMRANEKFLRDLVEHHISGRVKVAPEHMCDNVLDAMGKPHIGTFNQFCDAYARINKQAGKNQFIVPYLMSSHPGSTLSDAIALAEYLNERHVYPEQVQDFYPTPGTISTAMYYTGINPLTMEKIYVARTPHEKDLQRALLQWRRPELKPLVIEALHKAGRTDLIGYGEGKLISR